MAQGGHGGQVSLQRIDSSRLTHGGDPPEAKVALGKSLDQVWGSTRPRRRNSKKDTPSTTYSTGQFIVPV
ncbi:predicted protein [Chaetomium globosum CBS 148.51]|uniref:Uncharacterized protein n=1 Tax=Chaetomium globosum (strain ATCC 6205 / CBS 148.51 / DSM 1962 / NBRC 6347 / NRRL 1970) TaxID=306901 RepID=Q2GXH6_CHAGB|nr:uncharacterized protein CHGG_07328 [Chaetomium globosum CBS 148.51]EAQ86075.1 predicted protein [Chaetomium globosum CBS 148.51]